MNNEFKYKITLDEETGIKLRRTALLMKLEGSDAITAERLIYHFINQGIEKIKEINGMLENIDGKIRYTPKRKY